MPATRCFLTGASSGIGQALARELAGRGWELALAARNEAALRTLAGELDPGGSRILVLRLDVAEPAAIAPALEAAAARLGGLDVVVANAGIGIPSPASEITLEQVRAVYEVNVFGAIATLLHALPIVRRSPRPLLAGVSSLAAWRAGPGAASYNSSKSALSAFLEGIRAELAHEGIPVLEINPGFVRTPMTDRNDFPMPFLVEPAAAARTIARALERRRNRIAFPWPAAWAMAWLRRLPDPLFDLLNRRLARRIVAGRPRRD